VKFILKQKTLHYFFLSYWAIGFLFFSFPVSAQIETLENGGIVDKNTQRDDDEVDLDDSDYTPTGLSAQALQDGPVSLRWDDEADDEIGYKIQRRVGGGSWVGIADLEEDSDDYTDRSAKRDTTYSYRVRAYNNSSETDYSSTVTVTTVPIDPDELLGNDIVKQEIERVVTLTNKEKDEVISDLEASLRVANEDLQKSSEQLVETQACDISVIPEDQIQKEVESRCESFPGSQQISDTANKTGSLISQLFANTTARILMSGLLLFVVLNNVWWHMTHKTVRKELHYHKHKWVRLSDDE